MVSSKGQWICFEMQFSHGTFQGTWRTHVASCRMFGRRCPPPCRSYGRLRPVGLVFVSGGMCEFNVNDPNLYKCIYIYINVYGYIYIYI